LISYDRIGDGNMAGIFSIVNRVPDRKLMEELGITKQSTLSSWKMSVKKKMQEAMKDFNP
jgi:hypothetical protein